MTLLAVEGLSVALGGATVVRDLAFSARSGALVGLIGANGAGKSTALRAIAGVLRPLRGTVRLDGRDMGALDARERARLVAYLAQGRQINWAVAVERLVALGRLPHRGPLAKPGPADAAAVERALARAGVAALRDRPATSLSGGEQARALLARALAVEAPVLLADEPVASLDPYHQLQVMELLREAARAGGLVICVLHDLALAARFCDRLLVLSEGRLIADAPPAEALDAERLGAAYAVEGLRGRHEAELYVLPWRRMHA